MKKLIDLFAGAGGLTWGFYKLEYNIVETIEYWEPAVLTYNLNFKKNIKPADITNKSVKQKIFKTWKNKIDIIIGGFPCQGYSMAGKRNKNDPRNQLYKHTIEIIRKVRPKIFVLENVKGILSFRESDNILVIEKIIDLLSKSGYYSKYILLDASNFGVPQKRERVIFIGARKKEKKKVDLVIEKLRNHSERIRTVRDAISDLENDDIWVENHIKTNHSNEMIEKIKRTEPGKSVMNNFSDAFRKLYYDKPSPTVKENHGGVHIHPVLNRVLTPRELARLQSFPDDFIFCSNKSNILKQIGNAVPPKLSYEIAKIINEVFFNE